MSFLAGIGAAVEESGRIGLEEIKEKRRQEAADALADKNHMRSLERLGVQHQYGMETATTKREWSLEDAEVSQQQKMELESQKQSGKMELEKLRQSGKKATGDAAVDSDDPMARFSVKQSSVNDLGDETTEYVDPNTGETRREFIAANRARFQEQKASGALVERMKNNPSEVQAAYNKMVAAGDSAGAERLMGVAQEAGVTITQTDAPKRNQEKLAERNARKSEKKLKRSQGSRDTKKFEQIETMIEAKGDKLSPSLARAQLKKLNQLGDLGTANYRRTTLVKSLEAAAAKDKRSEKKGFSKADVSGVKAAIRNLVASGQVEQARTVAANFEKSTGIKIKVQ